MARDKSKTDLPQLDVHALAQDLPYNLRNIQALLRPAVDDIREEMDLKAGAIGILSLVWLNPGVSQKDLAASLAMKKSYVATQIKHLEERGLLSRKQVDADKRLNALTLTAEGHSLIARARQLTDALNDRAMTGVSPDERAAFFRILALIQTNLRQV
jgi:DNA-binding MarR family transcriptional regulator